MRKRVYLLMLLWMGVCLPACGVQKKNDVWDIYDIRPPVSGAPIDNDTYYVKPMCAGFDSPACLSGQ